MALVSPLNIHNTSNVKWSATQESAINREYPFTDLAAETPDQYVVRTYLQFLWLPESIMPLELLVPSLQRVRVASTSDPDAPHPLHGLLEPLLLSVRASSSKYHVDLPEILASNGGAGEVEETMMWFALNHEKIDSVDDKVEASANSEDAVLLEDKWRSGWLQRLERREVQIQILLYLLKLSLPGPPVPLPAVTVLASPSKSRRKQRETTLVPSTEERLESFMDKISMWQLADASGADFQTQAQTKDEQDWMQKYCERIVEPQFKTSLPEACELLRSKVFPSSPFSDDEGTARSRSPSPTGSEALSTRGTSRRSSRHPSPAPSEASTSARNADQHSRSRSLSVSLAEDANARRTAYSASSGAAIKRAFSREISMSRAFKAKPGAKKKSNAGAQSQAQLPTAKPSITRGAGGRSMSFAAKSSTAASASAKSSAGVTLVAATPVKRAEKQRNSAFQRSQTTQTFQRSLTSASLFSSRAISPNLSSGAEDTTMADVMEGQDGEDMEEEVWLPADSSPDILLLGPSRKRSSSDAEGARDYEDDDDMDFPEVTPVKKRTRAA
ncbi:hypothetical protein CONPUDRAFT_160342 [Coniophora puteana RWD-64-598 SS2]|uniref:DNA replication regulator Sld3 C-terminal domain-containing protein n=1 Tax=Coniophora puteana (strain RWD-64-598) TaxID=741705 RepID=R7SGX7_CONPW|nr:uncharacterized protein CONPUDRAFT_160342 [Coniophora puteana RWD-64-598 SS2]EIW74304.1 hypothetical protein CONPUDRAFT_160342 [Coniophora puteana RWD-64-598 SS2]